MTRCPISLYPTWGSPEVNGWLDRAEEARGIVRPPGYSFEIIEAPPVTAADFADYPPHPGVMCTWREEPCGDGVTGYCTSCGINWETCRTCGANRSACMNNPCPGDGS